MGFVRETDFIVIGAGVMGAATAQALVRSGRKVLLLEQFSRGHPRGSSHGRTRIFRLSYRDPTYVRMARKAVGLWRDLERETGETLLISEGALDLGDGVEANAAALEDAGEHYELGRGRDFAARFPRVHLGGDEPVLFQPDAGVLAAELAVAAFIRSGVSRGVELLESQRAVALERDEHGVEVKTEHGSFRAKVAVVTAGAWAKSLLQTAGVGLPVRVTRETVAYFDILGAAPPPIVEWGHPATYCLRSPGQGIKAAQHIAGPEVDPDSAPIPDRRSVEVVSEWVRKRLPTADPTPHHVETCLYTNTADESFVLERHGPIVVGSPCSGHGFKFAPLIGERLANLAEGLPA